MRKSASVLLAGSTLLAVMTPASASATGLSPTQQAINLVHTLQRSKNARVTYSHFTAAQKALFWKYERITGRKITSVKKNAAVPMIPSGKYNAASAACWSLSTVASENDKLGAILIKIGQTTQVCVSNFTGNVISVKVSDAWTSITGVGFKLQDGYPKVTATKNVQWEGRGIEQWSVSSNFPNWADAYTAMPCMQTRLNKDGGHYSLSDSCDPN